MKYSHRFWAAALSLAILGAFCFHPLHAEARKPTAADIAAAEQAEAERQAAYHKAIDSNQITNWPQGPQIYAESAIVMEASTGTILYNKDMNAPHYPASITKIMTALLTVENCSLDEVMTYSYYATHSIEAGSSSIGTTEGEQLTVEESLFALLLESANECGNGLAEHIAGSVDAFVEIMNQRAAELGCTNTHFVNPHGLHDENHYTTAHDMAIIMNAALQNEDFVRISGTDKYQMRATNKDEEITYMTNHHYMIGPYKGIHKFLDDTVIAGKTGGTTAAKNTLVTAAERNGMTLIVVTMRTGSTNERGVPVVSDTALLLDYASENFTKMNVSANESNFSIDNSHFFHTGSAIFGNSKSLIEIDKDDSIILPNNVSFSDAAPKLTFVNEDNSDKIATLSYTYEGQPVGSASILLAKSNLQEFDFDKEITEENNDNFSGNSSENTAERKKFIKINIRWILIFSIIAVAVFLLHRLRKRLMKSFQFSLGFSKPGYRRFRRRRKASRFRLNFKRKKTHNRYRRTPKKRKRPYSDFDL